MNYSCFDQRAVHVLQILKQANYDSWFVGGCVRDALLGKSFFDYDIATCAQPDEILTLFKQDFELDSKGKKFGCVRVNSSGIWCEITTLRKDISPDGRHAKVIFTSNLIEDASRRDFTINSLYWNASGLIDFFNGKNDLNRHIVRFIGDAAERVQEDYLRILRFFRFSSAYAHELDQEGVGACVFYQSGLQYLSGTRVWDEWKKTLFQINTKKVLQAIEASGIDITLFGGKLNVIKYDIYRGKDVLLLTKALFSTVHIEYLAHRLNLGTDQRKWLEVADSLAPDCDFREFYHQYGNATKELVCYWACKYEKSSAEIFGQSFWQVLNPVFPLSGKDVVKLGCQPGAIVGDCLKRTQRWWVLNNFSPNYEDCLHYAKSLLNK